MSAPNDYASFNSAYIKFLNHCSKILKVWLSNNEHSIHNNDEFRIFQKELNNYMDIYKNTKPTERKEFHIDLVYEIFKKHKGSLLSGNEEDDWLTDTDNNVVIAFGSNRGKNFPSKVHMSFIYNKVVDLVETTEKNLEGLPDEQWQQAEELNYKNGFMYYFYWTLFTIKELTDTQLVSIKASLSKLEDELGIINKQFQQPKVGGGGGGFEGLFDVAGDIAKSMGLNVPDSNNMPKDQMMSQITGMLQRPETKNILDEFKGTLAEESKGGGPPDLQKVIGGLTSTFMKNMPNNTNKEAMQEVINDVTGNIDKVAKQMSINQSGPSSSVQATENTATAIEDTSDEKDKGKEPVSANDDDEVGFA